MPELESCMRVTKGNRLAQKERQEREKLAAEEVERFHNEMRERNNKSMERMIDNMRPCVWSYNGC
jgi:hypothetical protein